MRCNRALLLLPFLAACTTPAEEYPSLALRDAERVSGTLEPVAPTPYVPPATPAAVLGRLDQLAAESASAHRAFIAEMPGARSVVAAARGAEFGSDGWARASVAVAGLEGARSRAMIALADLDRLMVDAAVQGGELDRIVAVRNTVTAQVDEQNATIEGLLRDLR
jgi:hypothetical protein